MKLSITFAALLSVTLMTWAVSDAAPPFNLFRSTENQLQWQSNLQSAHKVATTENKPMLLVFGADWCHFCKKLEKETLSSKEITKYVNETFVPVHLDIEKDKKVAEILKVSSLPCSIILSPNADLLGRIEGYHTSGPFYKQLETARSKHQLAQRSVSTLE